MLDLAVSKGRILVHWRASMAIPDFLAITEKRLPGFTADCEPLARWFDKISAHTRSGPNADAQGVVINQCKQVWHVYGGVVLLAGYGFGAQAMMLDRTIFELVAGVKYLIKNPAKASDFLDYGKTVVYELLKELGADQPMLAAAKPEYDTIKPRFVVPAKMKGGKMKYLSWHKEPSISAMVTAAGMGALYKTFYKEASSIVHADSFVTLVRDTDGTWRQVVNPQANEDYDEKAAYFGFALIGVLFADASQFLGIDCGGDLTAVEAAFKKHLSKK